MARKWLIALAFTLYTTPVTSFIPGPPAPFFHSRHRSSLLPRQLDLNSWGSKVGELFKQGGGPPKKSPDEEEPEAEWKRYELGGGAPLPSMDDLWRESWPTQACKDLMQQREAMNTGEGPPHVDHLVRPFGENTTVLNVFYRDSASWCPYCQSVWMMLEEKQLPYKVKKVNMLAYGDKPDWFFQVAPSGLMPVLEVEGRIIRESVDIMKFVDYWPRSKNTRPMYPAKEDPMYQVAEDLLVLERELYMNWYIWLFESPEAKGQQEFMTTLNKVEAALGTYEGPWFLGGQEPSLVDFVYAPWVERLVASMLYWKAIKLRGNTAYPNLNRFLDALELRPSYTAFRSDYYTIIQSLQPQFGRAYGVPAAKVYQEAIDGEASGSWSLDSVRGGPSTDDVEYVPKESLPPSEYSRQAVAAKLIIAHKRVPKYMLRALGRPGPQYRSPLADPYNEPNETMEPEVDVVYRYLILALLRGTEAVEPLLRADMLEADAAYGSKAGAAKARLVACLDYLRKRVGVPRDFAFSEARQLRAHLTWMMGVLGGNV